jgi:hypothetical protein
VGLHGAELAYRGAGAIGFFNLAGKAARFVFSEILAGRGGKMWEIRVFLHFWVWDRREEVDREIGEMEGERELRGTRMNADCDRWDTRDTWDIRDKTE